MTQAQWVPTGAAAAPPVPRRQVGFIVGPTGVGKSALALAVAERLGAEIVNADSRQLYCGMDIGTAKPSTAERKRVRHHLIDVRAPGQPLDVAEFRRLAAAAIEDIAARGHPVLVVGGSGLYLRVLLHGIFSGPAADPEIRRQLLGLAARQGAGILYDRLREVDPATARQVAPRDLYRIVRALEVWRLTGVPISAQRARHRFEGAPYDSLVVGLEMERAQLYRRLDARLQAMLAVGLLAEVRALMTAGAAPEAPPLATIGYRELAAHVRGELTLAAAVALAQRNTRRLAKRQLTWFRHQEAVVWVDAVQGLEQALELFTKFFAGNISRARS